MAKLYLDASKKIGEVSFFEDYTEEWGNAYTGMLPLVDSQGQYVAVLCVDIQIDDIGEALNGYLAAVFVIMLILCILSILGNIGWLSKRILIPLTALGDSMQVFADSSHVMSADAMQIEDPNIHTGDEIETLSVQMVDMMRRLKEHVERVKVITAEQERLGTELEIATRMQADMLPKVFPKRDDLQLFAMMTPAKEMGGDFYDFFMIDEDHMALVMADVSGKGVPAAMFMIVTKTLLKIRMSAPGTPSEALQDVGTTLIGDNSSNLFVTVWFGILTLSTGELTYANAGHEYPALMPAGGEYELLEKKENMPPLATDYDIQYTDETILLQKGDRLFLYTDGVPDAKSPEGVRFGLRRMLDLLNENKEASPEKFLLNMKQGVDEFAGSGDMFDDVTMMSLIWK